MQVGIYRYLKENNYHVSIIRDRVFLTSRAVLEGKFKHLREHGIRDSLSNVFNKCNMVVVYFTLWAKRATATTYRTVPRTI